MRFVFFVCKQNRSAVLGRKIDSSERLRAISPVKEPPVELIENLKRPC